MPLDELARIVAVTACSLVQEPDGVWRAPFGPDGDPCENPVGPLLDKPDHMNIYLCPSCGAALLRGVPHADWTPEMRARVVDMLRIVKHYQND